MSELPPNAHNIRQMRLVQVNYAYDRRLGSPAELLDRYTTLTGWAGALQRGGAEVLTVQRFHSSANVTRTGVRYAFGSLRTIVRAASAWRPDLVHINGVDHPVYIGLISRSLRKYFGDTSRSLRTYIVVQDHAGAPGTAGIGRAVRRRLLSGVDAFLFTTLEQADPWRQAGLIADRQRVYDVMEASTDLRPLPRHDARSASGITGDPAVLWVGRLNANKDPLTVLDGFERFVAACPNATLTMVFHEADLFGSVRARVRGSPALAERVRLVGEVPRDRMAAFYSAADVFVLGSHHEGSGYAVLEATACGAVAAVTDIAPFRAMLVTNIGHTSDVPPTYLGCLWDPGDAAGCARALDGAMHVDRRRVVEHFQRNLTWDAVGRRALQIYADVMRGAV